MVTSERDMRTARLRLRDSWFARQAGKGKDAQQFIYADFGIDMSACARQLLMLHVAATSCLTSLRYAIAH